MTLPNTGYQFYFYSRTRLPRQEIDFRALSSLIISSMFNLSRAPLDEPLDHYKLFRFFNHSEASAPFDLVLDVDVLPDGKDPAHHWTRDLLMKTLWSIGSYVSSPYHGRPIPAFDLDFYLSKARERLHVASGNVTMQLRENRTLSDTANAGGFATS